MTPTLQDRIGSLLSPSFPSDAKAERVNAVSVYLDSQTQGAFDDDGLANDLAGTGHFIVAETTGHEGWFANKQTVYRTKRFAFFFRNGTDLVLRELDPTLALNATSGLSKVPAVRAGFSAKAGVPNYRPPTFSEAQSWAASLAAQDPISTFIGNTDKRAGNEVQFWRGVLSLGIVNLLADIYPSSPS